MRYSVLLTRGAERDLEEIHAYLARTDGPERADRLLARFLEAGERLAENPERGSRPKELVELGILEYRQLVIRPYRIIYRVVGREVYLMVIADSRRDMQSLLARRLLDPGG